MNEQPRPNADGGDMPQPDFASPPTASGRAPATATEPAQEPIWVAVEVGKGKPLLRCMEGKEMVKEVALNDAGLKALVDLDLMREPKSLKVGALHNWVELDGELFRFDDQSNGAAAFEKVLNERYVSENPAGAVQNVKVFSNPASPTQFDLQFPACPHGFAENRRRHLNDETIQILQDPQNCKVLRKDIIVVLTPPNVVFKRRHSDLSESHLPAGPSTTVCVRGEDGQIKNIDLSQPVDLLHLTAVDLAAVFNHPAVNRRSALALAASSAAQKFGGDEERAAA